MKKILSAILGLSLMLSLCACGIVESPKASDCSHENWLEPTCTEPAKCARCGITEGEAYGHEWQAASCTQPETCPYCGETQGEPAPHAFTKWEISGESMSRACADCGAAETSPLDREVYFADLLCGHWDYYVDPDNNSAFWAYAGAGGPEFWPYARYDTGGSGELVLPVSAETDVLQSYYYDTSAKELQSYELSWLYRGFEIDGAGEERYSFSLVFPDGTERPGLLRVTEFELLIELKPDGSNVISLFKPLYHEQELSGYWSHLGSWKIDGESVRTGFYFLELNPDRSFRSNFLGGEISGTWHAKPIMDSVGMGHSKPMDGSGVFQTYVALWYEKDGRMQSFINGLVLTPAEAPEGSEAKIPLMYWTLAKTDWDAVDSRGKEALSRLPGIWTSESLRESFYAENGEIESEYNLETADFYIDFSEDGRFSAELDREYEGRYFLYSVRDNEYSDEEFAYISIYLMPDEPTEGGEVIRAEMYYYPDGLANAFRVYFQDNYENGYPKYSGIYFFRKG